MSTGTSTRGPMTAAKASPESIPKTATATAMANSKLLDAAVKLREWTVHRWPPLHGEVKGDKEHDHKIDTQRYGDPDYIER